MSTINTDIESKGGNAGSTVRLKFLLSTYFTDAQTPKS